MNRPGQQQRPPTQQQPQYRNPQPTAPPNQPTNPPYPYAMPPRNVLTGPGYLPQRVPLASPFMQPRATNGASNGAGGANFPFGLAHAGLPPHLQQQQAQQQQQQQHSLGSSGEAALDPNDFPALGAAPNTTGTSANNAAGTPQSTSSYASAGSAPQPTPAHSHAPTRDLTQDDFPALGENATPANNGAGGPPGLFGTGGAGGIPGMLNLSGMGGMMGRHPFDDKRHPNPPNPAPPKTQTQNPPNANASAPSSNVNSHTPSNANAPAWASSTPSSLPNPNGAQPQSFGGENGNTQSFGGERATGNGNSNNNSHPSSGALQHSAALMHAQQQHATQHTSQNQLTAPHPQTPAQQVLVSAADRWGLLGLLAMIREAGEAGGVGHANANADPRGVRLSGVGTDLGTMGLDMGFSGNLYSTFITPWADQSAAHAHGHGLGVEPEFRLPACYASVSAPPPGPSKASAFSDETLFFMFYASARDALQEVAAQELWNRNWRYHKDLRLWITKESGTAPSAKVPGGEQGLYTVWDADSWGKEHKEMSVLYAELEEKNVPAFVAGPGLVPVGQQGAQAPSQQQQQQQRGFGVGVGM
ncbi:NOT2 family protein [Mycena crocata]|nr:NOT2 family protein [Mycena crocata]